MIIILLQRSRARHPNVRFLCIASVAGCARLDLSTSEMGQRTKALRASLWHAGNVGWQIARE